MSTPAGADVPYTQGSVLEPSATVDGHSFAAHDYFNMIRQLIDGSTAFRTEDARLKAHEIALKFEKHTVKPADQKHVVSETDVAPIEDVRLRKPPAGFPVAPTVVGPPIDYALLAQAIVAAQQQQAAVAPAQVHEITDVPASKQAEAGPSADAAATAAVQQPAQPVQPAAPFTPVQ
jgi:hypothetical protein